MNHKIEHSPGIVAAIALAHFKGLLPCPFCGSTDLLLRNIEGWGIDCSCGANMGDQADLEYLVKQWNSRVDKEA